MWRNLALLLASVVVSLLALELATRYLLADVTTTGDNMSYFAQRWREGGAVTSNRLGYREREFAPRPDPGVYRIAVVGDSFTYGQGIPASARLTDRLEAALSRGPGRFEVLNFGVPGHDYDEHVAALPKVLTVSSPNFLLLQWFVNDVFDPDDQPPPFWMLGGRRLRSILIGHSALYYLANHAFVQLQVAMAGLDRWDAYYAALSRPGTPLAERARQRLARLIAIAREAHVPIAIVMWPGLWSREPWSKYDGIFAQAQAVCRASGTPCLDLRPHLAEGAQRGVLTLNAYDLHPSAEANAIATESTLAAFGVLWRDEAARLAEPAN